MKVITWVNITASAIVLEFMTPVFVFIWFKRQIIKSA